MANFEKILNAIELIKEVKDDIKDDPTLQAIIDSQITALENLSRWLKNK